MRWLGALLSFPQSYDPLGQCQGLRALAGPKEEVHNFWQFLQPQQFKTITFTTGKKMSAIVLAHSAYLKPARAVEVLA